MNLEEAEKYKQNLIKKGEWLQLLLFRRKRGEISEQHVRWAASLGDMTCSQLYPQVPYRNIYAVLKEAGTRWFALKSGVFGCKTLLPYYHKFHQYDGKPEQLIAAVQQYLDTPDSNNFQDIEQTTKKISCQTYDIARLLREKEKGHGFWAKRKDYEEISRLQKTKTILERFTNLHKIITCTTEDLYIRMTVDIFQALNYIRGNGKPGDRTAFIDFLMQERSP